jgi:undecaprenyl-diphosphatase
MELIQAFLLGIIQGAAEWLPVSSSGHLALAQQLMGLQVPIAFDVLLHLGTLVAVMMYYRSRLLRIIYAILQMNFKNEEGNIILFIIVGSIPTAIIGFAFHDFFESMFSSSFLIGIALILTGCILFATKFFKGKRKPNIIDAVFMGIAQGLAVAPGISRSGWTISTGMIRGVEKEKATDYSFILSIPALIGATLIEGRKITFSSIEWGTVAVGVLAALLVGYVSIAILVRIVKKGNFHIFALYCWAIGVLAIFAH